MCSVVMYALILTVACAPVVICALALTNLCVPVVIYALALTHVCALVGRTQTLLHNNIITICCGGGGIPVSVGADGVTRTGVEVSRRVALAPVIC